MKNHLFFLLSLFTLAACQTTGVQTETDVPPTETPAVAASITGIWLKNAGGVLDGLQLDASGRLHYLNMYSITGDAWLQQGDTLMLVSHTERYPQPDTTAYLLTLLADTLKLTLPGTETAANPEVYLRWKGHPTAAALAGRWTGPEGTWLEVFPASDTLFNLTFHNMDNAITQVAGRPVGAQVVFDRNGKTDTLQLATGDQTGMKWLAGKANCVRVTTGEGYCKD